MKTTWPNFTKFFVHVAYGSVLFGVATCYILQFWGCCHVFT